MPEHLPDSGTLQRDADAMGLRLDADQAERIVAFGNLLLRWNRAFNLVSRQDQDRLYHRHLLDSLSVAPWLRGERCLDVGTGAGLPGIPLAVARRDLRFTLIDRSGRKIRFVEQAIHALGLDNVEAICGDAAGLRADGGYDIVVSRAVAGLHTIWPQVRPLLRADGRLLLMAFGQRRAVPEALDVNAEIPAGARIVALEWLSIPGLLQPHGLLIAELAGTGPTDGNGN